MLWTDRRFVTQADLTAIDSEVADVAEVESLTISGDSGIVAQTIDEAGAELLSQMQRFGGHLSSGLVSANHLAAVFNTGGPGVNRTRILLGQVVVFDPSMRHVKNWVAYRTLYNFYRAASARSSEDRYERKMRQFHEELRQVRWPTVKNIGIPVVYRPMSCPAAVGERAPGSWTAAGTTVVGGTSGGVFDVAISYVDQAFYQNTNKYNAESMPSEAVVALTVPAGHTISVDLTGLNPPNGLQNAATLALTIVTPLNATGWNLYVGPTGGPLYLQNLSPYPITSRTIALSADPVLTGKTADSGQFPDSYYTVQDMLQRG